MRPPSHKPYPQAVKTEARKLYDKNRGSASARGYGAGWPETRKAILIRDNYTCRSCGRIVGMKRGDAHVDHIVSMERGGARLDHSNLQTLCVTCHGIKTEREDSGFGHAPRESEGG